MYKWEEVNWHKAERLIYKLQKRIYKASSRGDVRTTRRLQKLITKSWYAKLLSVRRVTQDNQGKKTAGVDGVKSLSPKKRFLLVNKLKLRTKVSPTRRVWIPKPGKEEKRPLGIPTMYDRALQSLVKLAIEPEWEAHFEPNSHGFRPARSCHDAMESIWLKNVGLELSPSKTRIAHTLKEYNGEKKGFQFLGFYIYQFKAGKCISGKDTKKRKLGFKTYISPSQESVIKHYRKLAEVIDRHKGVSQEILISKLNPIIVGWCNYFRPYQCGKHFQKIRNLLWWKLWKWGIYRHPNKGLKWLKKRYWNKIKGDNWVFSSRYENDLFELIRHTNIKTNIGHIKVRGNSSIFDGNLTYWSTRMGKHPQMPKRTASLLKKQKGRCTLCQLFFREEDVIETDHITPTAAGGKDEYKNLQLLHRHCHDKKTKSDLRIINNFQRSKRMDEFYKWFNKQNWIWKEDIPTMV